MVLVYIEGSQVIISQKYYFPFFEDRFCLSKQCRPRPDETLHNAAFHHVDQKSLETEFSIAICRPTGAKWQSKILFIATFDPYLSF